MTKTTVKPPFPASPRKEFDPEHVGVAGRRSRLRRTTSRIGMVRMNVDRSANRVAAPLQVPTLGADGKPVRPILHLQWDESTRVVTGWRLQSPQCPAA